MTNLIDLTEKDLKYHKLYLDLCVRIAEMSHATRKKVGGILVKNNNIIAFGWNGQPTGFPNECEDSNGDTLQTVLHAEENIFSKLAKTSGNSDNSTLYLTLSPCFNCAKMILQAGINMVIFLELYREVAPIEFLQKSNVKCIHFKTN